MGDNSTERENTETGRLADRHMGRQAGRHTDTETGRHRYMTADWENTESVRLTGKQRDRQAVRKTNKYIDRQADRLPDASRDKRRDRHANLVKNLYNKNILFNTRIAPTENMVVYWNFDRQDSGRQKEIHHDNTLNLTSRAKAEIPVTTFTGRLRDNKGRDRWK